MMCLVLMIKVKTRIDMWVMGMVTIEIITIIIITSSSWIEDKTDNIFGLICNNNNQRINCKTTYPIDNPSLPSISSPAKDKGLSSDFCINK